MAIAFDPTFLVELADKLGVIQAVKGKLLRQPDVAGDELVLVLEELSKVFTTIEAELVRYLSVYFDPTGTNVYEREALLALEGNKLEARVAEARGHSHKIQNIYSKYLDSWFISVLKPNEAQLLKDVFDDLSNADGGFILVLDSLVKWVTERATETLDLADSGDFNAANQSVRAARKEILPVRLSLAKAQTDLRNLQLEFIEVSGTV